MCDSSLSHGAASHDLRWHCTHLRAQCSGVVSSETSTCLQQESATNVFHCRPNQKLQRLEKELRNPAAAATDGTCDAATSERGRAEKEMREETKRCIGYEIPRSSKSTRKWGIVVHHSQDATLAQDNGVGGPKKIDFCIGALAPRTGSAARHLSPLGLETETLRSCAPSALARSRLAL